MKSLALRCAAVLACALASSSRAATIAYTASDLADTTPGQDLWQYSYVVSDFTFANGEGFSITFDRTLFTSLQSPPPFVNADWDVLTLQPDIALSSNGLYDALALRATPSLADPFVVTSVWLGAGTPAAQPFIIHDANFGTIVAGQTVPEPTTAGFFLFTVLVCGARRRHRPSPASPRSEAASLDRSFCRLVERTIMATVRSLSGAARR